MAIPRILQETQAADEMPPSAKRPWSLLTQDLVVVTYILAGVACAIVVWGILLGTS
jgi:hypothetical protein